jgi:hypothetical protein
VPPSDLVHVVEVLGGDADQGYSASEQPLDGIAA